MSMHVYETSQLQMLNQVERDQARRPDRTSLLDINQLGLAFTNTAYDPPCVNYSLHINAMAERPETLIVVQKKIGADDKCVCLLYANTCPRLQYFASSVSTTAKKGRFVFKMCPRHGGKGREERTLPKLK